MEDVYTKSLIEMIKKNIGSDEILREIINKIYEDGFYDGNQSIIVD